MDLNILDRRTQEKFLEFLGREPHPTGAGQPHLAIKVPKWPRYRFEWHPRQRKVYIIRATDPQHAECIAVQIETHGDAINVVNIFLRGVREGRALGEAKASGAPQSLLNLGLESV